MKCVALLGALFVAYASAQTVPTADQWGIYAPVMIKVQRDATVGQLASPGLIELESALVELYDSEIAESAFVYSTRAVSGQPAVLVENQDTKIDGYVFVKTPIADNLVVDTRIPKPQYKVAPLAAGATTATPTRIGVDRFASFASFPATVSSDDNFIVGRGETRVMGQDQGESQTTWLALIVNNDGVLQLSCDGPVFFDRVHLNRESTVLQGYGVSHASIWAKTLIRIQKGFSLNIADGQLHANDRGYAFEFVSQSVIVVEDQPFGTIPTIRADFIADDNIYIGSRVDITGGLFSQTGSILIGTDTKVQPFGFCNQANNFQACGSNTVQGTGCCAANDVCVDGVCTNCVASGLQQCGGSCCPATPVGVGITVGCAAATVGGVTFPSSCAFTVAAYAAPEQTCSAAATAMGGPYTYELPNDNNVYQILATQEGGAGGAGGGAGGAGARAVATFTVASSGTSGLVRGGSVQQILGSVGTAGGAVTMGGGGGGLSGLALGSALTDWATASNVLVIGGGGGGGSAGTGGAAGTSNQGAANNGQGSGFGQGGQAAGVGGAGGVATAGVEFGGAGASSTAVGAAGGGSSSAGGGASAGFAGGAAMGGGGTGIAAGGSGGAGSGTGHGGCGGGGGGYDSTNNVVGGAGGGGGGYSGGGGGSALDTAATDVINGAGGGGTSFVASSARNDGRYLPIFSSTGTATSVVNVMPVCLNTNPV